jgi:hypothetical protein
VNDGASLFLILFLSLLVAAFWRQILALLALGALFVVVTGAVQILDVVRGAG